MAGRREIKIKRIDNPTLRQVTFSKRRCGLMKKAHDLAVLCDAEVAVILFSSKGKLFEFASHSMGRILERYLKSCQDSEAPTNNNSSDNGGMESLRQSIQKSTAFHSNLTYADLEGHSLVDIMDLEQQVHATLKCIHTRKEELLLKHLQDVRQKMSEAQRTSSANADILKALLDFDSSDITGSRSLGGQGGFQHHCLQELPRSGSAFRLWAKTRELTCDTRKQPVIREDLNKLPVIAEE